MSDNVTFWTEGGSPVGMGHLVRSINVARELRKRKVPVRFLVNDDVSVKKRLVDAGLEYAICPLDGTDGIALTGGVVVLDVKGEVEGLVKALKEADRRVVLVENASGATEADRVVVPSPIVRVSAPEEKLFGGAQYIILGESFLSGRAPVPDWSLPLKVLVTMGGADPFNLTEMVVEALAGVRDVEVTVVVGSASASSKGFEKYKNDERFTFVTGVTDLAMYMVEAHIAFTAVGTTIYELAYMGVPSLLVANYADDADYLAGFERLGISIGLGFYKDVDSGRIVAAVKEFIGDRPLWERMSSSASGLTDGKGVGRVASVIEELYGYAAGTRSCGSYG